MHPDFENIEFTDIENEIVIYGKRGSLLMPNIAK